MNLAVKTMNALATSTIQETKPLIILQRIAAADRTTVRDCAHARGNILWLVKQVAVGDDSAFARLYETTGGLLFALLLRILSDSRTAEEMLQSVYAEFRREAVRRGAKREKSLTWLIGIANRRGIGRLPLDCQFEVFKIGAGKDFPLIELGKRQTA